MVDRRLHGYTNLTRLVAGGIEKRYEGPGRFERARNERDCIYGLEGSVPVPAIVRFDAAVPEIVLREVPGAHGQDLIEAGEAPLVLELTGRILRHLQSISPAVVPSIKGRGERIVHGDFGPQNLLINPTTGEVAALLDWEFTHLGGPLEDLAWAEWIVRMHHPGAVDELPVLHEAYGSDFSWGIRHAAMVMRCHELRLYCESQGWSAGAAQWRERAAATERWDE